MVSQHHIKRIALVGAESCGKTTLANELAKIFRTYVVPEYGRYYWDAKKFAGENPIWTSEEFIHIAHMQNNLEDHFATRANKVLLCDTNALQTAIWHRRYLDYESEELEAIARARRYDLVLFCPATIPFVQDGTRDGEAIRTQMSDWIHRKLIDHNIPFHIMEGSHEQRVQIAVGLIQRL